MKHGYVNGGWFFHACGEKLFKVEPGSVLIDHVGYCRKCKDEFKVTIVHSKIMGFSDD